jgi:hypothetical protein
MPGTRFDVKGAVGKEVRLMLPLSFITSFWPGRWLESSNDAQLGRQYRRRRVRPSVTATGGKP